MGMYHLRREWTDTFQVRILLLNDWSGVLEKRGGIGHNQVSDRWILLKGQVDQQMVGVIDKGRTCKGNRWVSDKKRKGGVKCKANERGIGGGRQGKGNDWG